MNLGKSTKNFYRFLKEWKWALLLLMICIVSIPVMALFGLKSASWENSFWSNAFSEFLGMFIDLIFGSIFTFVVIDKYIQYHKGKQWKKIKEVTYKNLYFILSNILLKLNYALPKEMRVGSYVLTEDIETLNDYLPKADFDIFVKSLNKSFEKVIEERRSSYLGAGDLVSFVDEQLYASLEKFKLHTKSEVTSLSSLIIHKLLNFSDDTVLLDDTLELEELFTSLMSKIKTVHRKCPNSETESAEITEGMPHKEIKLIWLVKIQEMLNRISSIAGVIQSEIALD